tara:strand:+ start:62 stop:241 length:180 start_codon:yes stop_codon:yes gene_type:complete
MNLQRLEFDCPECSGVKWQYDLCRSAVSNAPPAFANPSEEVSMSSSSLMQGLLIAENAG